MEMKTYADKINQQFTEEASNLVSLQQRLNDALELNPEFAKMLDGAVDEFKRRNKQWKSFDDAVESSVLGDSDRYCMNN